MARRKQKKSNQELDSVFLLKIVLFFILGTVWVRVANEDSEFSIPVGFVVGLLFAAHDHFQLDRKLEYVVLLVSTVVSFYLPIGLVV